METLTPPKQTLLERITENQNFVFFTFAVILFPLMLHTAQLLLLVSTITEKWYAYSFALGFDLAILHFAVNGRMAQAGAMAFVIFIINVSFYNSKLLFESFDPGIVKLLITLVISGTSAWVVHTYVVLFIGKKEKNNQVMELLGKNYTQEKELIKLKDQLAKQTIKQEEIDTLKLQLQFKETENAALKESKTLTVVTGNKTIECDTCKNSFTSAASHSAYKKMCQLCPRTNSTTETTKPLATAV